MSYVPVGSGGAVGAWEFISTATISNDATVDIDLTGTHKMFVLHIDNLIPANDASEFLWMRFSTNAGSSFLAGSGDYAWTSRGADSNLFTDESAAVSNADEQIILTRDATQFMGTATGESLNGFVYIHNANQTTNAVIATSDITYLSSVPTFVGINTRGGLVGNIDEVDAVQFLASAGNLTSGRISLYGVNDA